MYNYKTYRCKAPRIVSTQFEEKKTHYIIHAFQDPLRDSDDIHLNEKQKTKRSKQDETKKRVGFIFVDKTIVQFQFLYILGESNYMSGNNLRPRITIGYIIVLKISYMT